MFELWVYCVVGWVGGTCLHVCVIEMAGEEMIACRVYMKVEI